MFCIATVVFTVPFPAALLVEDPSTIQSTPVMGRSDSSELEKATDLPTALGLVNDLQSKLLSCGPANISDRVNHTLEFTNRIVPITLHTTRHTHTLEFKEIS